MSAHNEQEYIGDCLKSVVAQTFEPQLVIVVLDRCTDETETIARGVLRGRESLILKKNAASWRNSISENLEMARMKARGEAFVIVDADMVVPSNFLQCLVPQLREYSVVSALAKTDPSRGWLNRLVGFWEGTYRIAPGGPQPRGGARAISKGNLDEIGGFRDVYSWETDLDSRLRRAGHKVRMDPNISVLHRRKMTFRRSVSYQIQAGRARRELGSSFSRTLLHSIFRLRPFVVYGYLRGKRDSQIQSRGL